MKHLIISICLCLGLGIGKIHAQLTDGMTGLLHMVNAEVQKDATFMLGGNFLNKHNLPNNRWWGYNTYNYYLNITFLDRIEIAYICTLVQGKAGNGYHWPEYTYGKFVNQDRHFAGKIQLVKEGEWWKHMPAIAIGVSDPTTGGGSAFARCRARARCYCRQAHRYIDARRYARSRCRGRQGHTTYCKEGRMGWCP